MKKSVIYLCVCAVVNVVFTTSCQESLEVEPAAAGTRAVVIDKDIFAVKGRINVKLASGCNYAMCKSKSGEVEMQNVPSAMAKAVQSTGAYRMERVFKPAGIYEPRTVAAGLDRWYTIYFDESKDVSSVIQQFSQVEDIECAERIVPMVAPVAKVVPVADVGRAVGAQPVAGTFDDPFLNKQWNYYNDGSVNSRAKAGADCNVRPVWEKYTTGKSNVVVAVVDGGVDIAHEDLKDNLYVNEKELHGQQGVDDDGNGFVDDIHGYNFTTVKGVTVGTVAPDDGGHGTHVAGIVGARNNNGKGVAGIAGGNGTEGSGVRLMSCQIFSKTNEQGNSAAAIKYAADNGATICQSSWGYSSKSGVTELPRSVKEAIDYFIDNAGCDPQGNQRPDSPMKGGVIIFAAGNENKEFAAYPACYPRAISVSGMAWDFSKASYSNYANWVTIMAPGGDQDTFGTEGGILSTVPKETDASGYAFLQGTSMACPHVSGIAALILSYYGKEGFTNEELKSRLVSAYLPVNIDEANPMYRGKLGKGYIDAEAAFESDTQIAPERVPSLNITPDFINIDVEWGIAKDEGKTAAFYRLYLSPNELNADNIKGMNYREINGIGHKLGETLKFTFERLFDNKEYYVAVVAVDRWGHTSDPVIEKCKTKLNHAPNAIGFPEQVVELSSNDQKTFTFTVDDPDGHNWDVKTSGETKGVSFKQVGNAITVTVVPVLDAGEHSCTFVLSDDLGAKTEKTFTFKIYKYVAPKLEKPFGDYIIGLDEGTVNIPLQGHYTSSGSKGLTYKVNVNNGNVVSAGIANDNIQVKALTMGVTRIGVVASDGRQSSSDGSFQIRVVERKADPVYAIYPVPVKRDVNALLNPEITQAEFVVTSTVGERIMTATVVPDSKNVATLDLGKLSSGTYKLTVRTSKGDHTQMFIKR